MSKDAELLIGIDFGKEEDCQCATLNLYYNGTNHIIYQTFDKEQVVALNEVMKKVNIANPIEVMECFKRVWNDINTHNHFRQDFKDLKIIENYILKSQENEKMLNIIKEHPFESAATINYIKINKDNPEMLDYKSYCINLDVDFRVIKDEFELIKEAIKK